MESFAKWCWWALTQNGAGNCGYKREKAVIQSDAHKEVACLGDETRLDWALDDIITQYTDLGSAVFVMPADIPAL